MAKVEWFEAYEFHFGEDEALVAQSNNFEDLIHLLGDKFLNIAYEGYIVSVDTDLDGIPHSTLMCGFHMFRTEQMHGFADQTDELVEFIDEFCSDSEQTIYDSFTWDSDLSKYVLITHSDYNYREDN
jgi:hypothetical protein